ncbi:MAG TPA: hypothetical protein VIV65_06035 [Gemmatimonadaceae bacterium]|jgi:glucose/arabinose dehydrogenase
MHYARRRAALFTLLGVAAACGRGHTQADRAGCDPSLKLPEGFCATIVADTVGKARQIAVRGNGDIFVARLSSRRDSGGVSVIRKDSVVRFGTTATHGLLLASDSSLYVSTAHEVLHYRFAGLAMEPGKRVDTVVVGLPGGSVPDHALALDPHGFLLVTVSAVSSDCHRRTPCPDLATSGGIWRFDTGKRNQTLAQGTRIATGLGNPTALAVNVADTMVYAITRGPDSLHERIPQFDAFDAATHPVDELIRVVSVRADYGWPYCYYDLKARARVQSPDYGGDGHVVGACDRFILPLTIFPAHWEPIALLFPQRGKLPSNYRSGAFVAFHGSSHRAPLPEAGYIVAFVPFKNGAPSIDFETFADGFAGQIQSPTGALHRPSGLAEGPDGSIYVSDDKAGRIWRIAVKAK